MTQFMSYVGSLTRFRIPVIVNNLSSAMVSAKEKRDSRKCVGSLPQQEFDIALCMTLEFR
jgi:hypothetical protein